jgi:hypothetical protein
MNRHGDGNVVWMVIVFVLCLIVLAVTAPFLFRSFGGFATGTACETHGGTCQPQGSCTGETLLLAYTASCKEDMVCCKKADTGQSGQSGQLSTEQAAKQLEEDITKLTTMRSRLTRPSLRLSDSGGKLLSSGSYVTTYSGQVSPSTPQTFALSVDAVHFDPEVCNAPSGTVAGGSTGGSFTGSNDLQQLRQSIICDQKDWVASWSLQTVNGNEIIAWKPVTPEKTTSVTVKDKLHTERYTYSIQVPTTELPPAGQTRRLLLKVTTEKNPLLESRYEVQIRGQSPLRVSGLSSQWTKAKTATVQCQNGAACESVFFRVINSPNGAPSCTDGSVAAPSSQPILPVKKSYCIIDANRKVVAGTCFAQPGDCQRLLNDRRTTDLSPVLQTVIQQSQQAVNTNYKISPEVFGVYDNYQNQIQQDSMIGCAETVDYAGIPSGQAVSVGTVHAAKYDEQKNTGTIPLDQPTIAGEDMYLCAYAKLAGEKGGVYAAEPLPIRIDMTPPKVEVKFSPLTGRLSLFCDDVDERGTRGSGCTGQYGIGYVNTLANFFPALFAGAQSATTWCPLSSAQYSLEQRTEISYFSQSNEVRVLCLRAEDRAGNAGYGMTTVYNAYDTIAKTIALAVN